MRLWSPTDRPEFLSRTPDHHQAPPCFRHPTFTENSHSDRHRYVQCQIPNGPEWSWISEGDEGDEGDEGEGEVGVSSGRNGEMGAFVYFIHCH